MDIIALRKDGLRGQAFVIFEDISAATSALQADQGFTFFGKELKIAFARQKSDRVAKLDGTYKSRAKRQKLDVTDDATKAQTKALETKQEATEIPAAIPTDDKQNDSSILPPPPPQVDTVAAPPSNILFAQDIPTECNEMMLSILFRQYPGFKEVRIPRQGLAFAEYENEAQATVALKALNQFKLTNTDVLHLSYAKS